MQLAEGQNESIFFVLFIKNVIDNWNEIFFLDHNTGLKYLNPSSVWDTFNWDLKDAALEAGLISSGRKVVIKQTKKNSWPYHRFFSRDDRNGMFSVLQSTFLFLC